MRRRTVGGFSIALLCAAALGVLGVAIFGLSFWETALAIIVVVAWQLGRSAIVDRVTLAIALVSHDEALLAAVADRIVRIRDGLAPR